MSITKGSKVTWGDGNSGTVTAVDGETATVQPDGDGDPVQVPVAALKAAADTTGGKTPPGPPAAQKAPLSASTPHLDRLRVALAR